MTSGFFRRSDEDRVLIGLFCKPKTHVLHKCYIGLERGLLKQGIRGFPLSQK